MDTKSDLKNYTFVSYAHKDSKFVKAKIDELKALGHSFWFDESIEIGSDWAESIGAKIESSESVLYFKSKASEQSKNCRRELEYAQQCGKQINTIIVPGDKKKIIIPAALVAVLAIAFFILFKTIPNVFSLKIDKGSSMINDAGFNTLLAYDYSEDFDLGYIIDQDKDGLALTGSDVLVTQSLGVESDLTTVPDTVGSYISDGIEMLVKADLLKFTISSGWLDDDFGNITYQSAPAGYKISKNNNVDLVVATEMKPFTFEYNNQTYTVSEDEPVELDFTPDLVESAMEEFPDAEVIRVENPGDEVMISDRTFDGDVVITGEAGLVYFDNCTFNGDILNVNNTNAVGTMVLPSCTVNGGSYIIKNKIKEGTTDNFMPKLITWQPIPVECKGCAGAVTIFGESDIIFNGTAYSVNDVQYYIVTEEPEIVFEEYNGQEINMHYVGQWWENGQRIIHTDGEFVSDI